MRHFNPRLCKLKVDGRRYSLISWFGVEEIVGVRASDRRFCHRVSRPFWRLKLEYMTRSLGHQDAVEKIVGLAATREWCQEAVHALCPCYAIVPHQQAHCFIECLWSVVDVEAIGRLNCAKFVLDWLYKEFNKYKTRKRTYCSGCILFLVVRKYVILPNHYWSVKLILVLSTRSFILCSTCTRFV